MLVERIRDFISERPQSTGSGRFDELAAQALEALGGGSSESSKPSEQNRAWSSESPSLPDLDDLNDLHDLDVAESTPLEELAQWTAFELRGLAGLSSPPILELALGCPELSGEAAALGKRFGGPGSKSAAAAGRFDSLAARSWLGARQRDHRTAVILASLEGWERLIGTLERQDLRFQLAPGSRVIVLGGGRPTPIAGTTRDATWARLGIPAEAILSQWSWPGIPTPIYAEASETGLPKAASPPHWMRIRALDPETLEDVAAGEEGRLVAADLSISGRPFILWTQTSGRVGDDGVIVTSQMGQ